MIAAALAPASRPGRAPPVMADRIDRRLVQVKGLSDDLPETRDSSI
jgi:hypothetical protein